MKFGDKVGNIMDPKKMSGIFDFYLLPRDIASKWKLCSKALITSLKKNIKNNEALKKKIRDTLPSSICADHVPIKKKRVD